MAQYKILGSFTDRIKDVILRDTVLNKKYTSNHPRTKYILDDILVDILYVLKIGILWRNVLYKSRQNAVKNMKIITECLLIHRAVFSFGEYIRICTMYILKSI